MARSKGSASALVLIERVEQVILLIRGEKVILDADIAKLYGATTKALNQAVKRNAARFPEDFMFQLTVEEKREVVTICDHLKRLKFSPTMPYAFTEHGAIMAANILSSGRAITASVQVVRAFVRLRQILASHAKPARKLEALEKKYDAQFKVVFDAIWQLMTPPEPKARPIGFIGKGKK